MASLFSTFTSRFEQAGVPYMVTGSVAGMIYGEPRLTHDVDIVVSLDERAIEALGALFPDEEFYCPPPEVIRVEARRALRGHFNIIEHSTGFKADVYLVGRDPLHQWAMQDRRSIEYGGQTPPRPARGCARAGPFAADLRHAARRTSLRCVAA